MQATSTVKTPIGLAEIFPPEAIIVGLEHRGCITEEEEKAVVESILAREKLGSTALGNGIAFPHCRSSLTEKFIGILGIDSRGVPFNAVDGEPVHSIFLILAPLDGREKHYEVLGKFMAIGRDKSQRVQLRGCRTSEAVPHFLQELDRQ